MYVLLEKNWQVREIKEVKLLFNPSSLNIHVQRLCS